MGGGGGGGGKSTSRVDLPEFLDKPLVKAAESIAAIYDQQGPKIFEGPFGPSANLLDEQALQLGKEFINKNLNAGDSLKAYGENLLGGKYLNFADLPQWQNMIQQGIFDPALRGVRDVVLPSVRSSSIDKGAFGGSRNAVAETLAFRDATNAAAEAAARAGLQQYQQERQLQTYGAPGALQIGTQLQATPSEAAAALADQQRKMEQFGIDEAKAQFDESVIGPYRTDTAFLEALGPLIGAYGGGTSTKIQGGGSKVGGAVAGGIGGAAAGLGLAAALAGGPPGWVAGSLAALAGAGLGAGASFL